MGPARRDARGYIRHTSIMPATTTEGASIINANADNGTTIGNAKTVSFIEFQFFIKVTDI